MKNTWRGFNQKLKGINKNLDTIEKEIKESKLSESQQKALAYLFKMEEIVKAHPEAICSAEENYPVGLFSFMPMVEKVFKIRWFKNHETSTERRIE